mmetsp:Transcript_10959/g.14700  ORF Transcript_10959/g.14700 Transcript_10959/m.14700 type:complete len:339 (-) Transcript_10959:107-1123(-)
MTATTVRNDQNGYSDQLNDVDYKKNGLRQRIVLSNDFMKDNDRSNETRDSKKCKEPFRVSSMGEMTASSSLSGSDSDDVKDELDVVSTPEMNEYEQERIRNHEIMMNRAMSPTQEIWNGLTMIPNLLFSIYYLYTTQWIPDELKGGIAHDDVSEEETCSLLPPMTILAAVAGIAIHLPFSVYFHWCCACTLAPGIERLEHWSRRADQAGIHLVSALWSYSTSGSLPYFAMAALFNGVCMRKHFEKEISVSGNRNRILMAVFLYLLPMLWRGEFLLFFSTFLVIVGGFGSFAFSPIGSWSHCLFHVVFFLLPPCIFAASMTLPMNQEYAALAARCAEPL